MIVQGDGRKLRSAKTRDRLLAVGGRVFADRGFDGTTTRVLADAAGVNQAAILYHFGGKEGLYVAIAEAIATRGREAMRPFLTSADAPNRELPPAEARAALETLLRGLLFGLLSVAGESSVAAFIVREQTNPGPAFERLYRAYMEPVHTRVTALVAAATDRAPDDVAAILDAHAIIGMVLAFVVAREAALRRTGWHAYGVEQVEQIGDRVATLALSAVALKLPARKKTRRRSRRGPA